MSPGIKRPLVVMERRSPHIAAARWTRGAALVSASLALVTTPGVSQRRAPTSDTGIVAPRTWSALPSLADGDWETSARLLTDASATMGSGAIRSEQWLRARLTTPSFHRLGAEVEARGASFILPGLNGTVEAVGAARAFFVSGTTRVWAGVESAPLNASNAFANSSSVGFGLARVSGRLALSLSTLLRSASELTDSARGSDTASCAVLGNTVPGVGSDGGGSCVQKGTAASLALRAHWLAPRFEIFASAGQQFVIGHSWGRFALGDIGATAWLTRDIGVIASVSRAAAPLYASPHAETRAVFGLRLRRLSLFQHDHSAVRVAEAATASVEVSAEGSSTLRISAPAAERVEVMGDITMWSPVALTRAGSGRWESSDSLSVGVHRILVRVDGGEWLPPAGLPTIADEFQGAVGVLVVAPRGTELR